VVVVTGDEVKALLDNTWVLVAAILVIFMQAGFAYVEAGLTRSKDVANILMKNLMDFVIGALAFFFVGFGIMFGTGPNNWIGTKHFVLADMPDPFVFNLTPATFFLFQLAFAATAATIVSGAMAGRTRFAAYCAYSLVITTLIYPIFGHWMWGGGWLYDREFLDFAGSTVVHATGGWAALVGAAMVGPRLGRYGADGRPRAMPGHSVPMMMLGVFVLWIGWYGFNPGSQLGADFPIVSDVAVTTTLAGAAGGLVSMILTWVRAKKPDVSMTGNGVLAGLVAITAGCVFVYPWAAVLIGALAGTVVVGAVSFFDRLKIDDPVGAISVHGVCGAFGTLMVGVFAAPDLVERAGLGGAEGLWYGGGLTQLGRQAVGVGANFIWVVAAALVLFSVVKSTVGLRVTEEDEIAGLDVAEHGAPGYGEALALPGARGGTVPGVPAPAMVPAPGR
jgi:Amt family ammonium transporter